MISDSMGKILVIGGTGLLGLKLVERACGKYEIYSTYHKHEIKNMPCKTFSLDKRNAKETLSLITRIRPDLVVDTAALHKVDYCEENRKECRDINVKGTENVARACKAAGSRMVFISTDYVFGGERGEYREGDKPNPINYYGQCKLEAEEIVKVMNADNVIARTAVIYGWDPDKLNFVTWTIRELKAGKEIRIVDDQYSNPTLADDLADMIIGIFERGGSGVFNTTGSECVSRFDLAKKVAETFGLDSKLIKPIKTKDLNQKSLRPKRCDMNVEKVTKYLGRKPLNVVQGLEKMRGDER